MAGSLTAETSAFIREMQALGACEVRVGDVRVSFAPSKTPAAQALSVRELLGDEDQGEADTESITRDEERLMYSHVD
ncbi:MAG: hypothetical protein RLP09_09620 [Sandaracinaceae bacterium]